MLLQLQVMYHRELAGNPVPDIKSGHLELARRCWLIAVHERNHQVFIFQLAG